MKTPSETVQAAQRLLAEREAVGLRKYGTTVDRTDLQAGDWLQHAIEEASDLLLYLIRLRETMRKGAEFRLHRKDVARGLIPESRPAPAPATAPDDAERAAYEARWKDAPEWAIELEQFDSGICCWYGPRCDWFSRMRAGHNLLGRVACEPRPSAEGER